jgi:hypothetical protein
MDSIVAVVVIIVRIHDISTNFQHWGDEWKFLINCTPVFGAKNEHF